MSEIAMKCVAYLLAAMVAWAPPLPRDGDAASRYARYASTFLQVAFEEDEAPLYKGPGGRLRTALLLASIAGFESNYRADVETGATRGKVGDACLLQVVVPRGKRILVRGETYSWTRADDPDGWTAEDLVADLTKCVRAGLHIARESVRACGDLSLYTSGKCAKGEPKAFHREQRAKAHWRMHAEADAP